MLKAKTTQFISHKALHQDGSGAFRCLPRGRAGSEAELHSCMWLPGRLRAPRFVDHQASISSSAASTSSFCTSGATVSDAKNGAWGIRVHNPAEAGAKPDRFPRS